MIRYYKIENSDVVEAGEGEGNIRVHVAPTPDEIEILRAFRDLDAHTLTSALDPDEVPRIEFEADHFAVIWKRPLGFNPTDSSRFEVASMGVFVFADAVEIVLTQDVPIFEKRHFHRVNGYKDLVLRLFSRSIAHFLGHLAVIDSISDELKLKINTSMENRYLIQMFDLSESLVYYLYAISANGAVLDKLKNAASRIGFSPAEIDALDDVHIDNNQCYKQAEIFSTIITSLTEARGTLVNNNVNNLLRRLTVINTIFLPLTLIAGIGGMSEFTGWTVSVDWRVSYGLLAAGMGVIGLTTYRLINSRNPRKRSGGR